MARQVLSLPAGNPTCPHSSWIRTIRTMHSGHSGESRRQDTPVIMKQPQSLNAALLGEHE